MKVDDIDLAFTEDPNAEEDNGSGFYDSITLVDKPTTRYFYDGQMCMQEEITETVNEEAQWTYTRYGLGARGIDYIEKQVNQGSVSVAFPVYDGHGNMVMTLSRSGNGWSDGLHRSYDVWGSLRWNPSNSGDVKQRYCANLGHVEDDQSGLLYMRARFHEPWTGRFISEDPARDGWNWYSYCSNDPVTYADFSGKIKFTVGGYTFRLDVNDGDLHVFKDGVEVISRWASGAIKHSKPINIWTKDMVNVLVNAARSGNASARALLSKMKEMGTFGLPDDIFKRGGMCGVAYTSVDAYAQQDPIGFLDLMETIFTGKDDAD